jgi:transposase
VDKAQRVVIGMDPHKRSVTIEVVAGDETILGQARVATDRHGYGEMLAYCRRWPDRVWAIEGCNGIGHHVAHRLLADGQDVVDVPPKLSARARVFTRQIGSTPNSCLWPSTKSISTERGGRAPPRRKPRPTSR